MRCGSVGVGVWGLSPRPPYGPNGPGPQTPDGLEGACRRRRPKSPTGLRAYPGGRRSGTRCLGVVVPSVVEAEVAEGGVQRADDVDACCPPRSPGRAPGPGSGCRRRRPASPTAWPSASAPSVAEATPAPAATRPPATMVTAAAFLRFFTSESSIAFAAAGRRSTHWRTPPTPAGCAIRGTYPDGMNLRPERNVPLPCRRHSVPHRAGPPTAPPGCGPRGRASSGCSRRAS